MTSTPHLALPLIAAAQAQKHVTHNEALTALDALVQLAVLDRHRTSPPAGPEEGDRHIVAAGASGAWAGREGAVACRQDGAWRFFPPRRGWLAYDMAAGVLLAWSGVAWVDALAALGETLTPARIGLGTAADPANPFSAKLNDALWTARSVGEGGTGDLRSAMTKEAAADVLSLVFQTGFSARAELGLVGDDDFRIKVSPDGVAWRDAMAVDRASGAVRFPSGFAGRERLMAPRTYFVRADGSDASQGLADTPGGAFATLQKAVDTVAAIDLGGFSATIQVGPGTWTAPVVLKSLVGGTAVIRGDEAAPSAVHLTVASGSGCIQAPGVVGKWSVRGFRLSNAAVAGLIASQNAVLDFQNVEFGACATAHVFAGTGSKIFATGPYAIVGDASSHWSAYDGGAIACQAKTVTLVGPRAFATAFALAGRCGTLALGSNTFVGSATGPRYTASTNAVIDVAGAGANALPGNAPGSVASGGVYG